MTKHLAAVLLACLAAGSPLAFAQDMERPSTIQESSQPTAESRTKARDGQCAAGEPVSIWYLNNPQASGGLYNNPWADCNAPADPH